MPLSSMTGFARSGGMAVDVTWHWELKSVNGKALDIRMRLPTGFDQLEAPVRQAISQGFKRGNIQVSLVVQAGSQAGRISFNQDVLAQYLALAGQLRQKLGSPAPSPEALLALHGVVETRDAERGELEQQALERAMLESLAAAIADLKKARAVEGAGLHDVLRRQLDQISSMCQLASDHPARQPEAIRQRLKEQVAQLMEVSKMDEGRLVQEAVLLATRADVKEELDRLAVHIIAARSLLDAQEPVGRKFDFLAQEFNREANTLCSKSNDSGLTALGLDLKTVIDQMREQVQNIE